MNDVVIVSTARTPIGRAYRGAFNDTGAATLGALSVREAVRRAGVDPAEIEDIIMGAALQQGAQFFNIARQIGLASGFGTSVSGMTLDRQCSSGLMAIATGAKQVADDGMEVVVAGGLDSISLVQTKHMNFHRAEDTNVTAAAPHIGMPMLETAELVAERYGIGREAQDAYALQSQQRTAA
ncbi:MAG TPA: acetyl-CoA C-acyltransferase, partial [Sphingopyxis sp.]|nr:acetyl-CoA C-acyltransferase [Sphingopyxis sp.]